AIGVVALADDRYFAIRGPAGRRVLREDFTVGVDVYDAIRTASRVVAGNRAQRRVALVDFVVRERDRAAVLSAFGCREHDIELQPFAFFDQAGNRTRAPGAAVFELEPGRRETDEVAGHGAALGVRFAGVLDEVLTHEMKIAVFACDPQDVLSGNRVDAEPDPADRPIALV